MTRTKTKLKIDGMHCASCELVIERRFSKLPGVMSVNVKQGEATVESTAPIALKKFNNAVEKDGYRVQEYADTPENPRLSHKEYWEIGALFLVLVGVYVALKHFSLIPDVGLTENMSYGFIFVIGLIAATSTCLAVSGGLLLAVSAKYAEAHPQLSAARKFKPHLYFNVGRILSYAVLGGALGFVGSLFVFSPVTSGAITIAASVLMILLGLQMLRLWPSQFNVKMPTFIAHRVYDQSTREYKPSAPFLLGVSTFFLPCGFTQALQLYVLTTGNWVTGALTMLVFALGTAPALLGLGVVTSFTKGAFQKHFFRFAAVLVILLGMLSIGAGVTLIQTASGSLGEKVDAVGSLPASDPNVELVNGKQVVRMRIVGYEYYPSEFTIEAGKPVEWIVDGSQAAGCGKLLIAPKAGVREYVPDVKTFTFTPEHVGIIPFNCGMGMMTPGAKFTVVKKVAPVCDPAVANCAV